MIVIYADALSIESELFCGASRGCVLVIESTEVFLDGSTRDRNVVLDLHEALVGDDVLVGEVRFGDGLFAGEA